MDQVSVNNRYKSEFNGKQDYAAVTNKKSSVGRAILTLLCVIVTCACATRFERFLRIALYKSSIRLSVSLLEEGIRTDFRNVGLFKKRRLWTESKEGIMYRCEISLLGNLCKKLSP